MVSDYVRGLRERIGNDLLLLPSVAVLPRDERDRLFLKGFNTELLRATGFLR